MTGHNRILPKILWLILGLILLRMLCSWLLGTHWELFAQPEVAAYLMKEPEPVQSDDPVKFGQNPV